MVRSAVTRSRLLVVFLGLVAAMLLAPAVAAAPVDFVSASGEWTLTSQEQTVVKATPGVTILDVSSVLELSGTIEGTSDIEDRCVVFASGEGHCTGDEEFTGTVDGRSGTAEFFHIYTFGPDGSISGTFYALGGTGELEGIRGRGTFQGVEGSGTYSIDLIFTP